MTTTIKTNNQPRDFLSFYDFDKKDQKAIEKRFDYMTREELEEGCSFFKYKGEIYNLCEFMRTHMDDWDGALSHSYFSGIIIKISDDHESVICGTYLS